MEFYQETRLLELCKFLGTAHAGGQVHGLKEVPSGMEAAKGGSHSPCTPPFVPVLCQVGEGDLVSDSSNWDIQTSPHSQEAQGTQPLLNLWLYSYSSEAIFQNIGVLYQVEHFQSNCGGTAQENSIIEALK